MANDYRLKLKVALDDTSFSEIEKRIKKLKESGITDIRIRTNTDELGQMNRAVLRYKDSTGQVTAETFKLKQATNGVNAELQKSVTTTLDLGKVTNYWYQGIMDAVKTAAQYALTIGLVYKGIQQIGEGVEYITQLNTEMTKIQVLQVPGAQTREEISSLAMSYNELASEMSATTLQVAEGSVEWLRQGKTLAETEELLRATMMMSKLGAVESAEATTYLTSILNAYQWEASKAIDVVDKLVAVDNIAATSVSELAIAMQRSSVSAAQAGVTFEELVSYVATVSSVTRRSAENIGESFKTMFARMQDIKEGKVDSEGMGLNNVESALDRIGIKLRDSGGEFRNMSDVLEEVAVKWDTINELERANVAKAIAGVRQRENFLVLMTNMNKAFEYQEEMLEANGLALDRYAIYEESVEAATNRLRASWEGLWQQALSSDALSNFYDFSAKVLDVVKDLGGLETVVYALTAALVLMNLEWFKTKALMIVGVAEQIPMMIAVFTRFFGQIASGVPVLTALNVTLGATAVTAGALALAVVALGAVFVTYNKQIKETYEQGEKLNQQAWDKSLSKVADSARNASDVLEQYLKSVNAVNAAHEKGGFWADLFVDKNEMILEGLKKALPLMEENATSWDDYYTNAKAAIEASGYMIDEQGRAYEVVYKYGQEIRKYADGLELVSKNTYEAERTTDGWLRALQYQTDATAELISQYESLRNTLSSVADEYDKAGKILDAYSKKEFGAGEISDLAELYPDEYLNMLKIENGLIELNTDKMREMAKARAEDAYAAAVAAGESDEALAILRTQIDLLDKAIPMSTQYVEQFSQLLEQAGLQTENEAFRGIAQDVNDLNVALENGIYTNQEYFNQLGNLLDTANFEEAFEGNLESSQIFFSGLAQNAANAISQISSEFDSGKISITEYAEQLVGATEIFDALGSLTANFGDMLGMTSEQVDATTENLGIMAGASAELAQMQELNVLVQDAYVKQTEQTLAFGTQAYNDYMMTIAHAAAVSGQSFVDMEGNALSGAESIYGYLTASSGNFKNFANQTASKTGETIQKIVNSAGRMLQTLGSAISGFKARIDFTPNIVGSTPFPLMEVFGQQIASINMPSLSYNISGSGGETLQALGQAISGFGAELATMDLNFDANIYTNPAGLKTADRAASNLADTLGTVSNAFKDMGRSSKGATKEAEEKIKRIDDLLKLVVKKIKQEKEAFKDSLKAQLDSYKYVIKVRKELLKSMEQEKKYQDELRDKNLNLSAIQSEMIELQLDDSEEARARLLALKEQEAEARKEIDELQYQKGIELQEKALDDEGQNFENFIKSQIDIIDRYLAQPGAIAADAIDLINAKGASLYSNLLEWNSVYGSGIESDVTQAWNNAYETLNKYKNALGQIDYQYASGMLTGSVAPQYHSGGFVGGVSSNEEFAKLLKGEVVLTEGDMSRLMDRTIPQIAGGGDSGLTVGTLMQINVEGGLDNSVLPEMEKIAEKVIDKLNATLRNRGHLRGASQFSI